MSYKTLPINLLNNFIHFGPCQLTHSFANERRVNELKNNLLYVGFRVSLQPFQTYQNTLHAFYNLCHLSFGGLYRVVNGLPVLFINDPLI